MQTYRRGRKYCRRLEGYPHRGRPKRWSCQIKQRQKLSRDRDLGDFSDVWNIVFWVANGLEEDTLSLLIYRILEFFWVIGSHPLHANIEFFVEY